MLEILAAAALAAASPAAAPPTGPDVTVTGPQHPTATVVVGGDETTVGQLVTVWPEAAYRDKVNGHVTLSCKVDAFGLAEECRVASESPTGKGFGQAALQMRTTFKLKPATGPNGPIESMMTIALDFKAPDTQVRFEGAARDGGSELTAIPRTDLSVPGDPPERRWVTMLDHPIWAEAAGFDDVARAYPAKAGDVDGYAVDHCQVDRTGALIGCAIIKEEPENLGFGAAALSLAPRFRVSPELAQGHGNALWVDVPIRFQPPGPAQERTVASPTWLAGFDPDQKLEVFPPEAAAKGVGTGLGVARCLVAANGALTDCSPEAGDPDGLGFSEVAVKLASTMRMNPWSADGRPVDGAVFHFKLRLNLKDGS